MISQAFQACYFVEGCLSNRYALSLERVGYRYETYSSNQSFTKITLLYTQKNYI